MKKVILTLALVASVACLSSCNKTCSCQAYALGEPVGTPQEVKLSDYDGVKKCVDLPQNNYSSATKTGIKCE